MTDLIPAAALEKHIAFLGALRAQIIRLQAELAGNGIDQTKIQDAYARGRSEGQLSGIASGRQHIVGLIAETRRTVDAALETLTSEAQRLADKAFDEVPPAPKPVNVFYGRRVVDAKTGTDITGQSHVRRVAAAGGRASAAPTLFD